jgi:hypothetical protein
MSAWSAPTINTWGTIRDIEFAKVIGLSESERGETHQKLDGQRIENGSAGWES